MISTPQRALGARPAVRPAFVVSSRGVLARAFLAAAMLAPLSPASWAASAPPVKVPGADVILMAGAVSGTTADAGIELKLAPGWKTYWRYPGDSGVPPTLDWSGSENVARVEMEWPAPKRFADGGGGFSIGYKGAVLFPLKVELKDKDKPARLSLAFDFAVCEALCMPARADLSIALGGDAGAEGARISAARAALPVERPLGVAEPTSVQKVELDASATPPHLIIEVKAQNPKADLFAEGPDRWALPLPQKTMLPDGAARFDLPLDGIPAGTEPSGAPLTLTLVDGPKAIVTTVPVPPIPPR